MNKAQAQAKIAIDFNRALKGDYNIVDPNALPLIEKILFDIGLEFTQKAKENLRKANAISSGQLFDLSLPIVYQNANGGYTLEVGYPIGSKADKYYDYVNKGVKGVGGKNARLKKNSGDYAFKTIKAGRALPAAIFGWLNKARKSATKYTPVTKLERKRKSLKKILSESENKKRLAFAISTNIKKNGLKQTSYFDDALKILKNQDFIDALSVALEGDIVIKLSSIQKEK
jgi:hypothetical protein